MTSPAKQKTGSKIARNSAARLLAVQAVYQMQKNNQAAKDVVKEYLEHRLGVDDEGDQMVSPNAEHFSKVVQGVEEHQEQLLEMVAANRTKSDPAKEPLLNAHFLCGAYELMMCGDIDYPVILSDYVHVTQAFYENSESKLVNAVLDSIRKTVRD